MKRKHAPTCAIEAKDDGISSCTCGANRTAPGGIANVDTIKTWRDRCKDFDDGHITTTLDIQHMMQEEIDDLRLSLDRLRIVFDTMNAIDAAVSKRRRSSL